METGLFIADAADDSAHRFLDLVARPGRPAAMLGPALLVIDRLAADLAGEDDAVGRGHRLAGDARLRVLAQEQVDDRIGNLVRDLVGMALGNGLRGEKIIAAHGLKRGLDIGDIKKSLYGASSGASGLAQCRRR